MRSNTVQQEEVRGMAVLDHVPEGWKGVDGCHYRNRTRKVVSKND